MKRLDPALRAQRKKAADQSYYQTVTKAKRAAARAEAFDAGTAPRPRGRPKLSRAEKIMNRIMRKAEYKAELRYALQTLRARLRGTADAEERARLTREINDTQEKYLRTNGWIGSVMNRCIDSGRLPTGRKDAYMIKRHGNPHSPHYEPEFARWLHSFAEAEADAEDVEEIPEEGYAERSAAEIVAIRALSRKAYLERKAAAAEEQEGVASEATEATKTVDSEATSGDITRG